MKKTDTNLPAVILMAKTFQEKLMTRAGKCPAHSAPALHTLAAIIGAAIDTVEEIEEMDDAEERALAAKGSAA